MSSVQSSVSVDANEEAVKEAVLEAVKCRQRTDLILRCELLSIATCLFRKRPQIYFHVGIVLDVDGKPSDHTHFSFVEGVSITRGSASMLALNGAFHQ